MQVGDALDELVAHARRKMRPDQLAVFERNVAKMMPTVEKLGMQIAYLLDMHERFTRPPKGPAPVHQISQYSQRRKKRP